MPRILNRIQGSQLSGTTTICTRCWSTSLLVDPQDEGVGKVVQAEEMQASEYITLKAYTEHCTFADTQNRAGKPPPVQFCSGVHS